MWNINWTLVEYKIINFFRSYSWWYKLTFFSFYPELYFKNPEFNEIFPVLFNLFWPKFIRFIIICIFFYILFKLINKIYPNFFFLLKSNIKLKFLFLYKTRIWLIMLQVFNIINYEWLFFIHTKAFLKIIQIILILHVIFFYFAIFHWFFDIVPSKSVLKNIISSFWYQSEDLYNIKFWVKIITFFYFIFTYFFFRFISKNKLLYRLKTWWFEKFWLKYCANDPTSSFSHFKIYLKKILKEKILK